MCSSDLFLNQIKQKEFIEDFESQIRRRNGDLIWISETVRTIRGVSGELLCYEGSIKNITESKNALLDRQLLCLIVQ